MENINPVKLTARVIDSSSFVFIAETWEKELKPYKKASWKHESHAPYGGTYDYELKSGHFLAFPQLGMGGGFYAAHLYMVAKELAEVTNQVKATVTDNGLVMETVEGSTKTRITLKPRGCNLKDEIHHAVLGYH